MKYKVGDKVKVRSDMTLGEKYGGLLYHDEMSKLAGKACVVECVLGDGDFILRGEESLPFIWTDEMVERLVEETPKHMSAEDIVDWFKHLYETDNCNDAFEDMIDGYGISDLFEKYSPKEIVQKIEAYETKKAAKPIELEWYDVCRIIKVENDGVKKCVYEEEFKNTPFAEDKSAEDILKQYISDHEGEYFATVVSNCRVKKGAE